MTDEKTKAGTGKGRSRAPRWFLAGLAVVLALLLTVGWLNGNQLVVMLILAATLIGVLVAVPFVFINALIESVKLDDPAKIVAAGGQYPRWKLWLRRVARAKPFWRKRLGDELEAEYIASDGDDGQSVLTGMMDAIYFLLFGGVFVALLIQVVIVPIFFSPGFWEYGLAYPIAEFLGRLCASTGQCDLPSLVGGSVVGLLLVAVVAGVLLISIQSVFHAPPDAATVSEGELLDAVAGLDERLVRLRADLVLANVLPLSAEERVEDADAELEAARV